MSLLASYTYVNLDAGYLRYIAVLLWILRMVDIGTLETEIVLDYHLHLYGC